jgi:hypothetical protein
MCECDMNGHVTEVEKQLQGSVTPQLSYKKPHAGSTGNIHGLVVMSEQMAVTGMVGGEYWTVYRVVGRVRNCVTHSHTLIQVQAHHCCVQ